MSDETVADEPVIYPLGKFIRTKRSPFAKTSKGVQVYQYYVVSVGPEVECCEEDDELLLVPDAITVVMPWDEDEHVFHETQVMAQVGQPDEEE